MNNALLCKWNWRFANERDALWRSVISLKYGVEEGGWCTRDVMGRNGVGRWKAIRKKWGLFDGRVAFHLGNGQRVKFWKDKWCGDGPLCESFPSLFSMSMSKNAWVSEVWNPVGDGIGWTPLFARAFNDWEIDLVERLLQKIQTFRVQREEEDRVIWTTSNNGAFSVRSLYSMMEPGGLSLFPSERIWRARVPPKVAFFAWEASWGKVLTQEQLQRRGFSLANSEDNPSWVEWRVCEKKTQEGLADGAFMYFLGFPSRESFFSLSMASSSDSWIKEYYEASKLADDINGMISQRISLPTSGSETQRHASAIRRKITILGTRLDSLQSLLLKLPGKQPITEKEMNRRKDMLSNLRSKVSQMASTLNMSNFANRDSLLGPEIKPADAMSRTTGLDNQGLVGLQRQIMKGKFKYLLQNDILVFFFLFQMSSIWIFMWVYAFEAEQDEGLDNLEETVISTKHIALAVNEELDLHTRLIDTLDQHVDTTDSRLGRVQKNLAILNKRTKGGCTCFCMLLLVIGIVILIVVILVLIKYL
ncbi:Syntaxin-51 [Vitis vinifera]|uniref:Syntaxin-51 n=1 Tax=Vitis vinifera TaxID=29760 RepID=A0A438KRY5_VITVI|nr:Syntaxin-51 [Vitis vinifera]